MKSEKELKFERIYKKYRKLVDSICKYYMLPRRNDKVADDIYADLAQDVWLRMWERIDELDENKNLKYYISKYAMNTSIFIFQL
jgi:DNA-directed RNA polymerase specialized sigma24 family protein